MSSEPGRTKVTDFAAFDHAGLGVYHFFRDAAVIVQRGILVPAALEARVVSPLSVYLNGNGTMRHVINSDGNQTDSANGGGSAAQHAQSDRLGGAIAGHHGLLRVHLKVGGALRTRETERLRSH